jgi:hypothetical protein
MTEKIAGRARGTPGGTNCTRPGLVSGTCPTVSDGVGLNIGAHKEAAEHFLSALSMQEITGEKSKQLLQTLRRAFLALVCSLSFRYKARDNDVFLYVTRTARTLQIS